jgi:uncharacterized protein (TIGR02145 family)
VKKYHFIFAVAFFAFLISCAPEANDVSPFTYIPYGEDYGEPSSSSYGEPSSSPVYRQFNSVPIGSQVWMAENLYYAVSGSKYYNNDTANFEWHGHLYDWATAMAFPASCNYSACSNQIQPKHRGICPEGWHIPNNAEWDALFDSVGGSSVAGEYLKATSGWAEGGNGQDTYGFTALPSGYGDSGGGFNDFGSKGFWWTASENDSSHAYYRGMDNDEHAYWDYLSKGYLFSVRCLQN